MPPKTREVLAELHASIERGSYPPGSALPSEHDLAEQFQVNRSTIRIVLQQLRAEGIVTTVRGHGTVIRDRTRLVLPVSRYPNPTPGLGPWETACAQQGLNGRTEVTGVSERPADPIVADALGIEPDTVVLHRQHRMHINGHTAQCQEAWIPHDLAAETVLAAPGKIVGGLYLGLTEIGHQPSVADDIVTGRMPTPDEAEMLRLDQGSPVLDIRRTTRDRSGRAVLHTHIVVAADRVSLAYQQIL